MPKIVITVSHGKENPERSHIPFLMAKAALEAGHEVQVWLQGPAVNLCRIGYTEGVVFPPFPPIRQLIEEFVSFGGKLYLSEACLIAHQLDEKEYISNAKKAGFELLIQESLNATVFNY